MKRIFFITLISSAAFMMQAYTGNKDIVLPAESAISFKLEQPLEIRK